MARGTVLVASTAIVLAFNAVAAPFGPLYDPWPTTKHPRCDQASFARILPHSATLEKIAVVKEGDSYGEGPDNIAYPKDPTDLPALCALTVHVRSSSSSSYRFGLFLPDEWNSRFLVVGNGGFAGGINWLDMAAGPRYGMASLSTDTGHNSTATNVTWARNEPEKKTDWGWRAVHGSTALGKKLVRAYYRHRPLTYSYYSGCSTGGRQGLKELQKFPDTFDGALIGAAAWWTSHLNTYVTQAGLYNLPTTDPKHLSTADTTFLAEEVIRQCDGADGVVDGIVSNPNLCTPDLTHLLCPAKNTPDPDPDDANKTTCLTAPQINTAQNLYNNWYSTTTNRKKSLLHPGLTPSSEKQWYTLINGTEPSPYGVGYAQNFLFDDPSWDWRTFNESVVAYAEAHDPGDATADDYAALARVRKRGGKVILYHGMADGLVPTRGTEVYYNRTVEALQRWRFGPFWGHYRNGHGKGVEDFMRMFLVPGMGHCSGTVVDAPWNFAGAFQAGALGTGVRSVPGYEDAEHDAMMALMDWVEKGRPVNKIVATTWETPANASSGVKRQRPICAWPKKAVWDKKGDVDVAASWRCSN